MRIDRRHFMVHSAAAASAIGALAEMAQAQDTPPPNCFEISLAEWSLHRSIAAGKLQNESFAKVAREMFDIGAIEYVSRFFNGKEEDEDYLRILNNQANDQEVKQLLIMVDGEGNLGDPNHNKREDAINNHHKWARAAKALGCHSIRVNAKSEGSYDEQRKLAADGLARLSEFAAKLGLNVIVENHGGLSSNGKWLSDVLRDVGMKNCGSLPDFGNFYEYDRYQGVQDLMPFAKAVSAKSYDFDPVGNETKIDYKRMMKIVLDAGYRGYVGIEYEGKIIDEPAGILATKNLLVITRTALCGPRRISGADDVGLPQSPLKPTP